MLRRLRQIADGVISGVNRSCAIGEPENGPINTFSDRPTKFDLLIINLKTAKRLLSRSSYLKAGGSVTSGGRHWVSGGLTPGDSVSAANETFVAVS